MWDTPTGVGQEGFKGPKDNVFCHFSWLLLELEDKGLLLKTPHTLVVRYRESELELSWKFPASSLSKCQMFCRFLTEKGYQRSHPAVKVMNQTKPNCQVKLTHLYNRGTDAIEVANSLCLNLSPAPQETTHVWYCNPCQ